jgi:phosphoglycolate phosphatase-like HAD superfamily hydrolase
MIKMIIWDFDGVIVDSMKIREEAFRFSLNSYSEKIANDLATYHVKNGGLSRYVKFDYILDKYNVIKESKEQLLDIYAGYIRETLFDRQIINPQVLGVLNYMQAQSVIQFIASGSDHKELNNLCRFLNIDTYFRGIFGSPTKKEEIVENILNLSEYPIEKAILIGDSINDEDAALKNGIKYLKYTIKGGFSNESFYS